MRVEQEEHENKFQFETDQFEIDVNHEFEKAFLHFKMKEILEEAADEALMEEINKDKSCLKFLVELLYIGNENTKELIEQFKEFDEKKKGIIIDALLCFLNGFLEKMVKKTNVFENRKAFENVMLKR